MWDEMLQGSTDSENQNHLENRFIVPPYLFRALVTRSVIPTMASYIIHAGHDLAFDLVILVVPTWSWKINTAIFHILKIISTKKLQPITFLSNHHLAVYAENLLLISEIS